MIRMFLIFLLALIFSLPASAGWSDWDDLGETNYSTPSACSAGKWTFVFALNSQRQVAYRKRWLPTGDWSQWKTVPNMTLGGGETSMAAGSPTAYCLEETNTTRVALYVVGFDQRLWSNIALITPSGTDIWYSWNINPGFLAAPYSAPAVASLNGRQSHIFVIGADNRIYEQMVGATVFQVLVSEHTTYDPAAVWSSSDRLELFYRDHSGQIWHQQKKNNIWQPRKLIETEETFGSLSVVSRSSSTLDLFTKGPGNMLYHKTYSNGVWGKWIIMGGELFSSPGATVYAKNSMMVFASWKSDGTLRYRTWVP